MKQIIASLLAVFLTAVSAPSVALAQSGPLRIEITEGVVEPLPYAVPDFVAESAGGQASLRSRSRGWWRKI